MAYVGLNPVRATMAKGCCDSDFTPPHPACLLDYDKFNSEKTVVKKVNQQRQLKKLEPHRLRALF